MKRFVVILLIAAIDATIGLLIASGKDNLLFNNLIGFLAAVLIAVLFILVVAVFIKRTRTPKKETPPDSAPAKKDERKNKRILGFAVVLGLVFAFSILFGYRAVYFLFFDIIPRAIQKEAPASTTTVEEVIAKPDQWSRNISVPPNHWFRLTSHGKMIVVKTWDGREFKDEPGKEAVVWLGDDIRNANFQVRSLEKEEVQVTVLFQKKT